jgi:hypothetical protein
MVAGFPGKGYFMLCRGVNLKERRELCQACIESQNRFRVQNAVDPDAEILKDLIDSVQKDKPNDDLLEWRRFLNRVQEEGDETMQDNDQNVTFYDVYGELVTVSAKEWAETQEKYAKDEAMFLNEARRAGEKRGKIRGGIKAYQELLATGLLPKDMAEQKIAELNQELGKLIRADDIYPDR